MATLFRRNKGGIYYLKFRTASGEVRQSTGTKSRREAERIRAAVEADLAREAAGQGQAVPELLTWEDAWAIYAAALEPHKRPLTLYRERSVWSVLTRWAQDQGLLTLARLRVADVALWQAAQVRQGRSPVGVNTYLRTCKTVWQHLLRLQVIDLVNPFAQVARLPEARHTKFLAWPDVQRLVALAATVGRDIHLVFILGAYAGLRAGEILRARWEHVDWDRGLVFVDGTKSRASRGHVPLHDALRSSLAPYRQAEGWIVAPAAEPSGSLTAPRYNWRKQWRRVEALEAVQAEGEGRTPVTASPHQLRHSVATHLLDIGYTLQQVAVFLRHADDQPTRRYADLQGVTLDVDRF